MCSEKVAQLLWLFHWYFFIFSITYNLATKSNFYFMKQFNFFRTLLFASFLLSAGNLMAQVHPLHFGPHSLAGTTNLSASNWYKDYVGAKLTVTAPTSIAGLYACAPAPIGTGASEWPDIVWTTLTNLPIVMDNTCDSFANVGFTAGSMTGKIAVIWRGPIPISGACYTGTTFDFGLKAKNCQDAGAKAVVIINEYPGGTPFAPGYTAHGTPITIPVVMISNADGMAISGVYHASAPGTVKMSLTPWGQGNNNDLGLVPNGWGLSQYYAMPASHLAASPSAMPYKMLDGAFVANFGNHKATGTKLKSSLYFTPTGGSAVLKHTDSLIFESDFTGGATTDTLTDSIMAMFPDAAADYNLNATVPGRFDLTYALSSDTTDQSTADNNKTVSFYLTDSLFSRGRYDFANNRPLSNSYEAYSSAAEITWGTFYYIGKDNSYVNKVQFNVSNGRTGTAHNLLGTCDLYIFKWTDGSNGQTFDSLLQDGEMELVSWTPHPFVAGTDTSLGTINMSTFYDPLDTGVIKVKLDSGSWYYFAVHLPDAVSATDTLFLGIDGANNPFPRIFGRWWENGGRYLDYADFVGSNADALTSNPAQAEPPLPFAQTAFVNNLDSFAWTQVAIMIPSIAVVAGNTTGGGTVDHSAVGQAPKSLLNVTVSPNPAKDVMNVTVGLEQTASKVTYRVIDGMGRTICTETHNNVINDTYVVNTSKMAAGNYFVLISADDRRTSKKFTVVK